LHGDPSLWFSGQWGATKRSDIDVCLVKPEPGTYEKVLEKLSGKYDIKVFEELPLYIQIEVIKNHKVIYGDELNSQSISIILESSGEIWSIELKRISLKV